VDRLLRTGGIVIPARGVAPKTDDDDPIEFYYRPLTGRLYRGRLVLARRLLGAESRRALLEIGYGSGVFLPELARSAERVVGIDVHGARRQVESMLHDLGVDAELRDASLYELPYGDGEFDALVCLSVLEHMTDLDGALEELRRVLEPGGVAVLGFPARNPLTDTFFRLVGYDPRAIHPSGHGDILAAARRHRGFAVERVARMPWFLPTAISAYVGCRLRAR
jgi:SAM-dependent methyltransferase